MEKTGDPIELSCWLQEEAKIALGSPWAIEGADDNAQYITAAIP